MRSKTDPAVQRGERRDIHHGRRLGDFHRVPQLVAERRDLFVVGEAARDAHVHVTPLAARAHERQAAEQALRHRAFGFDVDDDVGGVEARDEIAEG